ncbi:MAG: YlbF family regulator [Chloroflexi bacterium]|nr:YlbF family regulator [Chloroflexota bacterium]
MQIVLSPQLQEATHLLIDNLLASEAFIHYHQARTRLNEDGDSHALLDQLTQSQSRARQKQVKGDLNQADLDSLRLLQNRVQRNSIIMDYAQAQQEAINFLRETNNEISELLGINFATFANHATC